MRRIERNEATVLATAIRGGSTILVGSPIRDVTPAVRASFNTMTARGTDPATAAQAALAVATRETRR